MKQLIDFALLMLLGRLLNPQEARKAKVLDDHPLSPEAAGSKNVLSDLVLDSSARVSKLEIYDGSPVSKHLKTIIFVL